MDIIWFLLAVGGLIGLAYVGVRMFRHYQHRSPTKPALPPKSPTSTSKTGYKNTYKQIWGVISPYFLKFAILAGIIILIYIAYSSIGVSTAPATIYLLKVGWVAILVSLVVLWIQRRSPHESPAVEKRVMDDVGWRVDPSTLSTIYRIPLSLLGGQVISLLVFLLLGLLVIIINLFGNTGIDLFVLPAESYIIFGLIYSLYAILTNDPPYRIKAKHLGILTFFDTRLSFMYLNEGTYYWYGAKFLFGISTDPVTTTNPETRNEDITDGERLGQVFAKQKTYNIYNNVSNKETVISSMAKYGSQVFTEFSIGLIIFDPIRWANFSDPLMEVANRSREAIREAVGYFRDLDCNAVKTVLTELLDGETVIVAFTNKTVGTLNEGTVVQDNSGSPLSHTVTRKQPDGSIDERDWETIVREQELEFREKVKAEAKKDHLGVALKNENDPDSINTKAIRLKKDIRQVAHSVGANLYMVALGDVDVSDSVKEAQNKVASESGQRESEQRTAESVRHQQEILGGGETALIIASGIAGVSNGSKVIKITGDGKTSTSEFVKAATVHKEL